MYFTYICIYITYIFYLRIPFGFIYSYDDYFAAWFLFMPTCLWTKLQSILPLYLFKGMSEGHTAFG